MTANAMAWKSGWNSKSNGQLMKTFVAYPAGILALGIGLESLPAQGGVHCVLNLLQCQPATPRDRGNPGRLARRAGPLTHRPCGGLHRAARDLAGHWVVTPAAVI